MSDSLKNETEIEMNMRDKREIRIEVSVRVSEYA